jgi:hypothetical protein
MSEWSSVQCSNCGAMIEIPLIGVDTVHCPVCQYVFELRAPSQIHEFTPEALETSLSNLMAQARASGLDRDEIVRVLRDELEFAAELAHTGRNMTVQIIDLGPLESHAARPPIRDRTTILRGRVVGR